MDHQLPIESVIYPHVNRQPYQITQVLGSGGFGITYEAYDWQESRYVALKEYFPVRCAQRDLETGAIHTTSGQVQTEFDWGRTMFMEEAHALARFHHRSIVPIRHVFEANNTAYIAMDLIEGESLSAHLSRVRQIDEIRLKKLFMPLLDALEVVHQSEFLHRDIKPSNIMMKDLINACLVDFGAARPTVLVNSPEALACPVASPPYAPPEQYHPDGHLGPWTDIFSLASVAFECLRGLPPPDVMTSRSRPMLTQTLKKIEDKQFIASIDWAMAVNPSDRPQSIAAWRAKMF